MGLSLLLREGESDSPVYLFLNTAHCYGFSLSKKKEESDVCLSNFTADTNQKSECVQGVLYLNYFNFLLLVYAPSNIKKTTI